MQTEPRATTPHAGGDEGVEDARQQLWRNALAVIGHAHRHAVWAEGCGGDGDARGSVPFKGVRDGIRHQVGQHLPQRAGVAVQHQALWHAHHHLCIALFEHRAQREHDFIAHFAQVKTAALGAGLVGSHLFETGNQLGGALQVALGDVAAHLHGGHEPIQ